MHRLRRPAISHLSAGRKERMHNLMRRWEIVGKPRDVLIESLRVLSRGPEQCTLLGTRKQIRERVRYVAFVSHNGRMHPQEPALLQKDAQVLLGSVKELGIRKTMAVLDVG
ncbi:MAG: hypothetical protein PHV13_05520 [Candidatus ainarchaeum sp.]|nr:hypothetical protein [Candidatus ainarchaeum sp.]